MPCNLYGTGDNFSLENSHVLPAMIRKMHEAKLRGDATLKLWRTGTPLREFLHADDLAEACLMLLDRYSQAGHINVGSGEELTIRELAGLGRPGGRFHRPRRVRPGDARRHAAQADGRLPHPRPRLEASHHHGRRHPRRLRLVSRERRRSAEDKERGPEAQRLS
jgi:nucleoside-diphosphate-sugar epimerase